ARAPRAAPATTVSTVTGCTPGTTAKSTRPAAASPPSVATSATSRPDAGPVSNQPEPARISAPATRRSESAASCGSRAVHTEAAKAAAAAQRITSLGMHELSAEGHGAVGDGAGERRVVGDDERGALAAANQCGELGLAGRIDAARGLVEHE